MKIRLILPPPAKGGIRDEVQDKSALSVHGESVQDESADQASFEFFIKKSFTN